MRTIGDSIWRWFCDLNMVRQACFFLFIDNCRAGGLGGDCDGPQFRKALVRPSGWAGLWLRIGGLVLPSVTMGRSPVSRSRPPAATVVTFKADPDLVSLLGRVRNRSEFIRSAILAASGEICPVCNGSGVLTSSRRRHWDAFLATHRLAECGSCHEQVPCCHGKAVKTACRP